MQETITLGNLIVDAEAFTAAVDGQPMDLTYMEFQLLFSLAKRADCVVTRQALEVAMWGSSQNGADRRLTIHVSRLRRKIQDSAPYRIETVKKRGYTLTALSRQTPEPKAREKTPYTAI